MTTTPDLGPAEVVINTRTLRIGHQTYQLRNLARVQTLQLQKPPDAEKGNKVLAWLAFIGVMVVIVGPLASATNSGSVGFIGYLAAIGVGIFVNRITKKPYVPLYALVLETTGNPITALASPDRGELDRMSSIIVNAIENPPETEKSYTIYNVATGDQINQYGANSIGKMTGLS